MNAGEISIYRVNDDVKSIRIELTDDKSRNRFITIEIDPKDLMLALTGFSGKPIKYETHRLEFLGKKKETEDLVVAIIAGEVGYYFDTKKQFQNYLEAYEHVLVGDGWKIDTYLGSQNSIKKMPDGSVILNVSKYRYI